MKTDLTLLAECLDEPGLQDEAREAFQRMHDDLTAGRYKRLTKPQHEWVEGVHGRLGLDPGAANLVSSGAVTPTKAERESLRQMLASLGPKPLKPPGRRA